VTNEHRQVVGYRTAFDERPDHTVRNVWIFLAILWAGFLACGAIAWIGLSSLQ
jgi:hypothetical protein